MSAPMTPDERCLLLLLAKMVLGRARRGPEEKDLRDSIRRIEETESLRRDAFVAEIMRSQPR